MDSINDIKKNIFKMRENTAAGNVRNIAIDEQYQCYLTGGSKRNLAVSADNVERQLKDPDFLFYLMGKMPEEYKNLPEEYKNNKKYVLEAAKRSPSILEHVAAEFKNDKEIIKEIIEESRIGYEALFYTSENLKNDKDLILLAVNKEGQALQYASEELKNDKEVISTALFNNKNAFKYVSDELKDNKNFVSEMMKQFNPKILSKVEYSILPNYVDVGFLFGRKQVGNILEHVSDRLKNDKGLVLHSIENEIGFSLDYVSEKLKDNKEIVFAAVGKRSSNFKYASETLRNDKELAYNAIRLKDSKIDKELLAYASPEIQNIVQEKGLKGLEEKPESTISSIIKGIRNLATGNSSQNSNRNSI